MMESWVKVAAAPDETDALLMDGVLKDAGIPSLIQRARLRCPGLLVCRSQGCASAGFVGGRSQAGARRHHGAWVVRAVAVPRRPTDFRELNFSAVEPIRVNSGPGPHPSQVRPAPSRSRLHTANPQPLLALDAQHGKAHRRRYGRGLGIESIAYVLLTKPPTQRSGAFRFYGICRQKREPTSGLEPLTCSLLVSCSTC